jgi:putative hydrolase of the HAD superfamily
MSKNSAIHGISFDAAGTLICVAEPVPITYTRLAAEFGITVDGRQLEASFRTLFPRMAPLAFGRCDEAARQRQERQWWQTLVRHCLGRHGQHPRFGAYFDRLFEHYRRPDSWTLYPEVVRVLDALDARDIPAAVTSNFDARLLDVLDGLGIRERFRSVVYSSAAGSAKPQAAIFHLSCEALGCPPAALLHVGDDARADLAGAREAGLQACWVRRKHAVADPSSEIPDLEAILPLLSSRADARRRQT